MACKFTRRFLAAALCSMAALASAQSWPTKNVTIVVPFPAGGTTDVLARAVSTKLSAAIGQSVIVENKPLAQALFRTAEIGEGIPADHYKAVAEVLAYVYRLKRKYS